MRHVVTAAQSMVSDGFIPAHRVLGWLPDLPDFRDHKFDPFGEPVMAASRGAVGLQLPSQVDLWAGPYRTFLPPIWDQGPIGSCTGHGVARALAYKWQQKHRLKRDFSRLFTYYNARLLDGNVNADAGATIRSAIKGVAQFGGCTEELWPYDVRKFLKKPTKRAYNDADDRQAVVYSRLEINQTAFMTALASDLPVVFGFAVYESFLDAQTARTGVMRMPSLREALQGGHCVVATGYRADGTRAVPAGAWCDNSWSSNWGIGGRFLMPWEYIQQKYCGDAWVIKMTE